MTEFESASLKLLAAIAVSLEQIKTDLHEIRREADLVKRNREVHNQADRLRDAALRHPQQKL